MGWPPTWLLCLVHLDGDLLRTRATVVLEQGVVVSFLSHGDHPAHWLLQLLRRWRLERRGSGTSWIGAGRMDLSAEVAGGSVAVARPDPSRGKARRRCCRTEGEAEDAASPAPSRGAAFRHAPRTPCIAGVADLIQVPPALAAVARGGGARNRGTKRAAT